MAEGTREEATQRRAEGREKRRSMLTEPFEQLDEETGGGEGSSGSVDVRETLKRAAVTGLAAAAVGALAGAAKALLDRRSENDDQPDDAEAEPTGRAEPTEEDEQEEPEGRAEPADDEEDDEPEARAKGAEEDEQDEEPEGRAEPADDEQEDGEPQGRAEPAEEKEEDEPQGRAEPAEEDDGDEPEGRAESADDEQEDEEPLGRAAEPAEAEEEDEPQGRAADDHEEQDDDRQQGQADLEDAANADSDPREIVPKAREELERLLGREVESVSGFERRDGHWNVMLEVVEMRRIPDSSDVLASYEVTLDDDGRLAQMTRRRRYNRSEVEVG